MPHDVFVSYSTRDKASADTLVAALEAAGVPGRVAPRDIQAGLEWSEAIVSALSESRAVLLVFSSGANESPQVRREVQRAFERGVTVMPVRVEDVRPGKALEYYISPLHWLDAMPVEDHLQRVVASVKSLLAGPRTAERADVRAGPGEAIAYATPAPAGWANRWPIVFALAAGGGMVLVVLGALAYRWASVVPAAVPVAATPPPPPAVVAATPAAVRPAPPPRSPQQEARQAVAEVLGDLRVIDGRLASLDKAVATDGDAAAVVRAVRELGWANRPYVSQINVPGTTKGQAGSASNQHLPDRISAFQAIDGNKLAVRAFADALFDVMETEREMPLRADAVDARLAWAETARKLGLQGPPEEAGDREAMRRPLLAAGEQLRERYRAAHVYGLRLLQSVRPHLPADAGEQLDGLTNLGPGLPPDGASAGAVISDRLAQQEAAARAADERQAAAEADADRRHAAAMEAWSAKLNPPFKLAEVPFETAAGATSPEHGGRYRPTADDPRELVRAKALEARRDGRPESAAAAFVCYAALFGKTDPAAEEYARAAVQYTLQFDRVGRREALYLSQLFDGAAKEAGLAVGDVVYSYGGKPVVSAEDLAAAVKDANPDEPVPVECFRRDEGGRFQPKTATLPRGGTMGAVFWPI